MSDTTEAAPDDDRKVVAAGTASERGAGRWSSFGMPAERSANFGGTLRRLGDLLRDHSHRRNRRLDHSDRLLFLHGRLGFFGCCRFPLAFDRRDIVTTAPPGAKAPGDVATCHLFHLRKHAARSPRPLNPSL